MPTTSLGFAAYFSPKDDIRSVILANARMASKSIHMAMYGYHLPDLQQILIAKHKDGVQVQLLLDHTQAEGKAEKPDVEAAIAAGLDVVIGTSPEHHAILHSKVMVIDATIILTGSYNFSLSAQAESNTLYVFRWPDLAAQHIADFDAKRQWVLQHEAQYQSGIV